MSQMVEYIKIALMNIKSNKARSILTMLGIIIGISSVIMILSIGNGVKHNVNSELNSFAGGQIYIYCYQSTDDGRTITFGEDDIELLLEKIPHLKAVTPSDIYGGTVNCRKGNFEANITDGTVGLEYSSNDKIIKGRYFSQAECDAGVPVCVINESSAKTLFGNTNVVGMPIEVTIANTVVEYTIVGIRQDNAATMINISYGADIISMETPYTVLSNIFGFEPRTSQLLLICDDAAYSKQVAKQAVRLMENKYDCRNDDVILVQNFTDIMEQMNAILNVITGFIVLVAAISLLVGGIGVMNIMLVSVTERTREIGIRKALGARTGSIMLQFLAESAIISMLGGIIGIILGISGAALVCLLMKVTPYISVFTIVATTLFSMSVGIFFGIYPARKAAKLSPIEALRHE